MYYICFFDVPISFPRVKREGGERERERELKNFVDVEVKRFFSLKFEDLCRRYNLTEKSFRF